jgi:hypothetical protein
MHLFSIRLSDVRKIIDLRTKANTPQGRISIQIRDAAYKISGMATSKDPNNICGNGPNQYVEEPEM